MVLEFRAVTVSADVRRGNRHTADVDGDAARLPVAETEKILTVRYCKRFGFERVTADLGGVKLPVTETEIRRGTAYTFTAGADRYTVNAVDVRGERYVSLYENDTLVRESCCARDVFSAVYAARPDTFDSFGGFLRTALWPDAIIAGFLLSLVLLVLGLCFDVFRSVWSVVGVALAVFVLSYALTFGVHALLYGLVRRRMRRLGILGSAVPQVRRKRRR